MESWNHILTAALLGTEKRMLQKQEFEERLSETFELIAAKAESKEDLFLQAASLLYNYRQSGVRPLHQERVSLPKAGNEEKPYASPEAHQVLAEIFESEIRSLLYLWLTHCAS